VQQVDPPIHRLCAAAHEGDLAPLHGAWKGSFPEDIGRFNVLATQKSDEPFEVWRKSSAKLASWRPACRGCGDNHYCPRRFEDLSGRDEVDGMK